MSFSLLDHWNPKGGWSELTSTLTTMHGLNTFLGSQPVGSFHPDPHAIFRAFELIAPEEVNVVILGQDPYHDPRATGIAFSVESGQNLPASLASVYDAIESDLGESPSRTGDLTPWVEDGVLLLNTLLTVGNTPKSHAARGWELFTDAAIDVLNRKRDGVVFLLWGVDAWRKAERVNATRHYLLPAHHPRPRNARLRLARSRHFSLTNLILASQERKQVRWLRA